MLTLRCRLLADAEFFKSRICKIDGSGDLGEQIVKVIQGKTVINNVTSPPAASEVPTAERKDNAEQNGATENATAEKKEEVKP